MMELQEEAGNFLWHLQWCTSLSDVLWSSHLLILSLVDIFKLFHDQQWCQPLANGAKVLLPKENYKNKGKQSESLGSSFQVPLLGSNVLSLPP